MRSSTEAAERIKGWFADHEAIFNEYGPAEGKEYELETLIWKKPDSGHFAVRYVIMGSVLMVWGDLEEAVYRWSSPITWEFLAACSPDYFAGKCQASPKGREYVDFDRDLARRDFEEALERRAEEGYDKPDLHDVNAARQAIQYGEQDWNAWLMQDGHTVFGPEWYEWVPSFGKEIAQTCNAHLLGIKLAVAQLAQKVAAA